MKDDLVTDLTTKPEVHVWLRRLDPDAAPPPDALACLGAKERERAAGFRRDVDRNRFIGRHVHLRQVLARYLDLPPDQVPLLTPLHQPPRLVGGDGSAHLRFSLSSSADRSLVGVAWKRRVGVDIERINPRIETLAMAGTAFSSAERQALAAVPAGERDTLFFKIWARKEAFVKALGVGFGRDLMSFDVLTPAPPGEATSTATVIDREPSGDDPVWWVRDIEGPADFALACCAEGEGWTIVSKEDAP